MLLGYLIHTRLRNQFFCFLPKSLLWRQSVNNISGQFSSWHSWAQRSSGCRNLYCICLFTYFVRGRHSAKCQPLDMCPMAKTVIDFPILRIFNKKTRGTQTNSRTHLRSGTTNWFNLGCQNLLQNYFFTPNIETDITQTSTLPIKQCTLTLLRSQTVLTLDISLQSKRNKTHRQMLDILDWFSGKNG